jgi:glycosyltransferase involved in cell wall biosynthesis
VRILVDYRPALRQRTGVGEYFHELVRALVATARTGETLALFSSSLRDRLAQDAVPGAEVVDRRVPVRLLNFAWHRLEWPPVERLAGGPFDIVHAAHPLLIPSSGGARLVTIHDLDFLDHPERTRAEIRRDYPELAARHAAQADQVVVVSRYTAAEVESRFGIPGERITVCNPGAPEWTPRPDEPQDGHLLFLGTLEPRKNLGVLLDAYERLLVRRPGAPKLVLAGSATPQAGALIERATRPPFAGRVELPGYVGADAKRKLFDGALIFVMPSHTEGFGMTSVEALAAGVPVIAANRGALPEAVGPAGRLVEPDDAEAMARALDELLADAGARRGMRDAGLRHVEQFRWTRTAGRIREAWAQAVEHRKARRG